jgi:hypothetical protein
MGRLGVTDGVGGGEGRGGVVIVCNFQGKEEYWYTFFRKSLKYIFCSRQAE